MPLSILSHGEITKGTRESLACHIALTSPHWLIRFTFRLFCLCASVALFFSHNSGSHLPLRVFFFFFWFLFLNLDRMYCGPLSYGACTQPPSPYVSSMQTLKIPTPWSTSFVCRRRSRIFYHFSLKRNSKPSATDVFSLVFSSPLLESQTKFEP